MRSICIMFRSTKRTTTASDSPTKGDSAMSRRYPPKPRDADEDDAYARHKQRLMDEEPATLSTGDPSTLKSYRALAVIAFGPASAAVKYLDKLIAESPNGENEVVIADEGQMIHLLAT